MSVFCLTTTAAEKMTTRDPVLPTVSSFCALPEHNADITSTLVTPTANRCSSGRCLNSNTIYWSAYCLTITTVPSVRRNVASSKLTILLIPAHSNNIQQRTPNTNQMYLYSQKSQSQCLNGFYNLYSETHPLSLCPWFKWKKKTG